ncbi:putative permease [Oleiagrimonas soli]|uniref:Putative permease n=1 Tax=Oleiagrimonas soli TaxID=1543381 RepID=A0A841KK65_9GAMM|nr:putative permease [Oleiagrimonas soli]
MLSVTVMGVGLGLMMFVFSMVNSLILQPLPLPHAERLISVGMPTPNGIEGIDGDQYLQLRGKLRGVDRMGAYREAGISLDSGHGATYYRGARLTASMMRLLDAQPLLGRGFVPADDALGAPHALLLGETLWREHFGADPKIVGRSVRVDGEWATVVGVMPAAFGFPGSAQAWLPLRLQSGQHTYVAAVARMAPGVQLGQVRAELDAWAGRLQRTLPSGVHTMQLIVAPVSLSFVPRDMRRWVWLMFGAGVLVLLLACINVANLQLVQTLQRRHELSLRSALGGSRMRLLYGALAEGLLLGAAALALAFLIVHAGGRWIDATWVANHPESVLTLHGTDASVIAFGIVVALLSTMLSSGIPAWRATRADDLQDAMRDGSKGSGSGFARVSRVMVVVEVALTVVLLVGAGTFVRSLHALMAQPAVGASHAAQVLTADVALPPQAYKEDAQRIRFFEAVVQRLQQNPEVVAATASDVVPAAVLGSHEDVSLPGQPQPADGWPRAQMAIVDAHFLDTYGVHLREGRFLDARDRADSAPVVVIDAKMAAAYWPHRDALDQKLVLYPGKPWARTLTVVGVIQSLQMDSMLERPRPGLLVPLQQSATFSPLHDVGLAVRTHADASTFAPQLIDAVHSVDPQAAVYAVRSQADAMATARVGLVVLTGVFSALGLVALLLAAAGLYGVLAFSVAQRTREIGIRRAIGAGHGAILLDTGRQLFWQLGLGLGIGLLLSWPWSKLLADPGLHTRAHDPGVFVPVLATVIGISALATLVPMLRALRVDPAVALRYE